jgi:hypothetical protein
MGHDHRRGPVREGGGHVRWREQHRVWADVCEHRGCPGQDHGLGRRYERVGGDDDLVARPDAQGHEGQQQGIKARPTFCDDAAIGLTRQQINRFTEK